MARFKTLDDLAVAGRRVLVRADLNVPMQDGEVSDATRIERLVPTLLELADKGAKVVVLSHFGRPKGKVDMAYSLCPLVGPLSAALGGRPVAFAEDCVSEAAKSVVDGLADGGIALLENTRFHAGEEKNDPALAQAMADLGDFYVNDAFSAAHRAHASTEGIARLLPCAVGRLMQQELEALEKALTSPQRPVMAVVGGAKVSSKLDLLGNLVAKVDKLAIGGGMANTFLVAQGIEVGKSLAERDMADTAREIMAKAEKTGCTIHLPVDVVVAREFKAGADSETVAADACPADAMILDAGPATVAKIREVFEASRTLIWNGPLGAFEIPPFDAATNAAAQEAARLTREGKLISVAGGGDTVAALNKAGVSGDFTFISTAGGAFLEWMEGKELPGVAALQKR
jgi:phosphoglycerate kinase